MRYDINTLFHALMKLNVGRNGVAKAELSGKSHAPKLTISLEWFGYQMPKGSKQRT